MSSYCEENFLYTICKYLSEQNNNLDREIAQLLNYAELNYIQSTSYSNRWNCVWATAVFKVPYQLKGRFTKQITDRLLQVLNEFRPEDWEIDFSDVVIENRLEQSYNSWRNDMLQNLNGQCINNQACFNSTSHPMYERKGIKFRSKSEMSLMSCFEAEKDVIFFPLPIGISGTERKEPDYLICKKGKWAILEVVDDFFHPSVEKESDRIKWFQDHSIQIRSYSADECRNSPQTVVTNFLNWLDTLS